MHSLRSATPGERRSWGAIRAAKLRSYKTESRRARSGGHSLQEPGYAFPSVSYAGRTALPGCHSRSGAALLQNRIAAARRAYFAASTNSVV
jgi:hypothetical protein